MPRAEETKRSTRHLRPAGLRRRELLLNSAVELLHEFRLEDITFKDVYQKADIPAGSAYHFFANKEQIVQALVDRYYRQHEADLMSPLDPGDTGSWIDIVSALNERAAAFHNKHAREAQAQFSPQLSHGTVVEQSQRIGDIIERHVTTHIDVTPGPPRTSPFHMMVFVVGEVFGEAIIDRGWISSEDLQAANELARWLLTGFLGAPDGVQNCTQ